MARSVLVRRGDRSGADLGDVDRVAALERYGEHGEHHPAAAERRQFIAQPLGASDRVVLEPSVGEAGCRSDVVIGTEGDDDDVGVVSRSIGDDVPSRRVDVVVVVVCDDDDVGGGDND